MLISQFERRIERIAERVISEHYPYDWKEDAITHRLLIEMRRELSAVTLDDMRSGLQIEWEAYKLHGLRESDHGDIGLLIRHRMSNGAVVEGAGFLEAKARGRHTSKFPSVRLDQVSRILERSPQTRLILYDYNAAAVLPGRERGADFFSMLSGEYVVRLEQSHAPTMPLALAAQLKVYDDTLYAFAHGVSHQLVRRYFFLHDLDFSAKAVDAVKSFPASLVQPAFGPSSFVMHVRIAAVGQALPERENPDVDIYREIE